MKRPDFNVHRQDCKMPFAPVDVCGCRSENVEDYMTTLERRLDEAQKPVMRMTDDMTGWK